MEPVIEITHGNCVGISASSTGVGGPPEMKYSEDMYGSLMDLPKTSKNKPVEKINSRTSNAGKRKTGKFRKINV